jgi:tRNA U54 and U55 pseudouridine synthase Pus10
VRVLHRRSPLVRPRVIHELRCEPINNRFFVLHVR